MAALILALVWITASHLLLVWLLIRATNRPRKRLDEDEEMPLKDLATVQTDTATVQTDTDAMVDSVQTEKENGDKVKDESIEEVKLEKKEEKKEKEEQNEEEG